MLERVQIDPLGHRAHRLRFLAVEKYFAHVAPGEVIRRDARARPAQLIADPDVLQRDPKPLLHSQTRKSKRRCYRQRAAALR